MLFQHSPTHPAAIAAIRAAKNRRKWGRFATLRFAQKRNVPHSLLTLAIVLENAKGV